MQVQFKYIIYYKQVIFHFLDYIQWGQGFCGREIWIVPVNRDLFINVYIFSIINVASIIIQQNKHNYKHNN